MRRRTGKTVWLRIVREKDDSRVAVERTKPAVEPRERTEPEDGASSDEGGAKSIHCGVFPQRQRKYRRVWWLVLAGLAAASALCWLFVGWGWGTGLVCFSLLLLCILSYSFSKELNRYYKTKIVPQCVKQICEQGTYEPNSGIDEPVFVSCGLFPKIPDSYATEDQVRGRIGRTWFRFAEIHAREKRTVYTKNGTRTTWVDIFRGFFFVADFNKHFRGQTTLVPNFWGAKWLAGRERVLLENEQLMKRFLVCSTDQVEARYILTPSLMERIMGLWKRYPKKLSISFTGSCIMVARACSKDHYEAGLWRSLLRCVERDAEAIRGLTAIVEELDMNTRIWTKE